MKKIAVGDLGEFWYADYKEPLQPFEAGVGYVGALLKDDTGKLMCNYCGKTYEHLGLHVYQTHRVTAAQYKSEVGLLQKSALVSESYRLQRIAISLRNRLGQKGMAHLAARRTWRTETSRGELNGQRSPELRNKRGTCYAQLMTVARSIVAERGRVTIRDLIRRGISQRVIATYFPDSKDFYRAANSPAPPGHVPPAEALGALRGIATEIGRTPAQSDLRRFGLPSTVYWRSHFGSYTEACRRAGLDPNLPTPDGRDLDLSILTAYATVGNINQAARAVSVRNQRVMSVLARYGCPYPPFYSGPGRKEWAADMARRLAGVDAAA